MFWQLAQRKNPLSRPAWGAWIEMTVREIEWLERESRPAWGAWIEIRETESFLPGEEVAPRMGRVD